MELTSTLALTDVRNYFATSDEWHGDNRSIHATIDMLCRAARALAPATAESALDSGCTDVRPLTRGRKRDAWDLCELALKLNTLS